MTDKERKRITRKVEATVERMRNRSTADFLLGCLDGCNGVVMRMGNDAYTEGYLKVKKTDAALQALESIADCF